MTDKNALFYVLPVKRGKNKYTSEAPMEGVLYFAGGGKCEEK